VNHEAGVNLGRSDMEPVALSMESAPFHEKDISNKKSKNLFFGLPSGVGPTDGPGEGFLYVGKLVHIHFDFKTTNPASIRTLLNPISGCGALYFSLRLFRRGC
jgi:hypothetical protein